MLTFQSSFPSSRPPIPSAARAASELPTSARPPASPPDGGLEELWSTSGRPASPAARASADRAAEDARSLGLLSLVGRSFRAGFDAMLAGAAKVTGREPPGLRVAREETIETLTARRNTLGAVAKGLGLAGRLGSDAPVRESSKWAAAEAVGGTAEAATLRALQAAGRGASAVGGGFVAGELVGTAVEEVIDGFLDTDASQWSPETSLGDRTRTNARRGAELFRETISRRTPWGIAGGLFTATYHVVGTDVKAATSWVLDRLGFGR